MDEIIPVLLLILSGVLIRFSLIFAGQSWAKTYSQTITFLILPIITYVITKTISNNIALSLGMIGALSIVRFRHPVKSAIELVVYFDLITLGIAASVRTKWAIQLVLCTILIIILTKFVQQLYKRFNRNFYNISFSEGNINNIVEITSEAKIDEIENNNFLISAYEDRDLNQHFYKLVFNNKKALEEFKSKLSSNKNIKKINVIFN